MAHKVVVIAAAVLSTWVLIELVIYPLWQGYSAADEARRAQVGFGEPVPWSYYEIADDITGDLRHSASSRTRVDSSRGSVIVRCEGNGLQAYFLLSQRVYGNSVDAIYRFDDREPRREAFTTATTNDAVFHPRESVHQFVADMTKASMLRLRVHGGARGAIGIDVDLRAAEEPLSKVLAACGLSPTSQ